MPNKFKNLDKQGNQRKAEMRDVSAARSNRAVLADIAESLSLIREIIPVLLDSSKASTDNQAKLNKITKLIFVLTAFYVAATWWPIIFGEDTTLLEVLARLWN